MREGSTSVFTLTRDAEVHLTCRMRDQEEDACHESVEQFDVLIFGSGAGGKITAWTSGQ